MTGPKPRLMIVSILITISLALVTGCIYRSGPRILTTDQPKISKINSQELKNILERSLDKSKNQAGKFRFQGWISSKIQNRIVNLMLNDGMYDREKGFFVKGSLLRKNFIYYRWKDRSYMSVGDQWREVKALPDVADPYSGIEGLLPAVNQMTKLPDEKVLGYECFVFQVELHGDDIRKIVPKKVLIPESKTTGTYLPRSQFVYTIWIGKNDYYIYQYKTLLKIPVPGAGMLYQTTFFRFWDYNSRNINIQSPERVGIN